MVGGNLNWGRRRKWIWKRRQRLVCAGMSCAVAIATGGYWRDSAQKWPVAIAGTVAVAGVVAVVGACHGAIAGACLSAIASGSACLGASRWPSPCHVLRRGRAAHRRYVTRCCRERRQRITTHCAALVLVLVEQQN